MSDRASKALAEASLPGEPRTYDATSKRSGVPLTTLYHRDHVRRSKEEKAQGQQYLTMSGSRRPATCYYAVGLNFAVIEGSFNK